MLSHYKTQLLTCFQVAEGHEEGDSFREQLRSKDFTFDFSFWTVDREDSEKYDCQEKVSCKTFEPLHEKNNNLDFQSCLRQPSLYSHTGSLET